MRGRFTLRLLMVVSLAVVLPGQVAAIRYDWTDDQIACAKRIGVRLDGGAVGGSAGGIGTRAWVADIVVRGTVSGIDHDRQPYWPTTVTITVAEHLKGYRSADTVKVMLRTGPHHDESTGKTGWVTSSWDHEFDLGEEVILFLTDDLWVDPRSPDPPRLREREYLVVARGKYVIVDGRLVADGWTDESYTLKEALDRIAEVVQAQASDCE